MNHKNTLYQQAIENEKQMRLDTKNKADYELADKLRKELFDTLGIESNYLVDFYYRTITNAKCIPILAEYIPLFENVGIGLNLVTQQFWRKNNKECSNFLEQWYYDLKSNNALTNHMEEVFDNAFVKIQDKSKVAFYLKLIQDTDKFPLIMILLGKWNVAEAKPTILYRLETDTIKTSALKALGYYHDKTMIPMIEKHLHSSYAGVRKSARQVLNKLNKL